jgi:hypothetical protein
MLMSVAADRLMEGASVAAVRDGFVGVGVPPTNADGLVAQLVEGVTEEHATAVGRNLWRVLIGALVALAGLLLPLFLDTAAWYLVVVVGLATALWGVIGAWMLWRKSGPALARLRAELESLSHPPELRRAA